MSDDNGQQQIEQEEQQLYEQERTGEANGNRDFCIGREWNRQIDIDAQFGSGADPFDSGAA
jgi:hypothetical protein